VLMWAVEEVQRAARATAAVRSPEDKECAAPVVVRVDAAATAQQALDVAGAACQLATGAEGVLRGWRRRM